VPQRDEPPLQRRKPWGDCSMVIVRPADSLGPRQATVAVVAAMSTPTKSW